MSSSSVDNVRFGYLKNTYLNYTFLIGVEKNNDDARRNYFSSNFHGGNSELTSGPSSKRPRLE